MKMSFRWYGKNDPVSLEEIKAIPGMQGIVTAVYDVPVGQAWPLENILELKKQLKMLVLKLLLSNQFRFMKISNKVNLIEIN